MLITVFGLFVTVTGAAFLPARLLGQSTPVRQGLHKLFPSIDSAYQGLDSQKPLQHGHHDSRVTITEQSDELCDAGSRQWTGFVQLPGDKAMFFWYFESRNDPENDPVILWMSGGPGATGEFGIFQDSGPCHVNEDGNSTSRAEYSWTNKANVLYIDQPAGIGFSQIKDRSKIATNLLDGGRDLYSFLSIFVDEAFPELKDRTWHIAGESTGGHYTTAYTKYILQQDDERQRQGLAPLLPFQIKSVIAVNAYIDATRQTVGFYDFFCVPNYGETPLMNSTACAAMAAAIPECERLGVLCRQSYDPVQCLATSNHCDETVGKPFWDDVKPGGWNPYDSRKKCTIPPLCSPMDSGSPVKFLNRPWVQKKLGFEDPFNFEIIDFDLNNRWVADGDVFVPTTRELTWLLDEAKIRVVFINGNNDIIINTPGQVRMLDEQPWHQQAKYRAQRFTDWYYRDGLLLVDPSESQEVVHGGQMKVSGLLGIFTVNEAGHVCPYDNSEAVEAVLDYWIQG